MDIIVSLVFKVQDNGDGTKPLTISEVARSTMHYIPDYVDKTF